MLLIPYILTDPKIQMDGAQDLGHVAYRARIQAKFWVKQAA